jgi:uncharacterized membrane protein HdeD (DUF308 family)
MRPEEQFGDRAVRVGQAGEAIHEAAGDLFRRAWWAIAFRGLLAIVLGIVMLTWPGVTLAIFIAMLGIYLFFDGIFALVATFHAAREGQSWWPYLLEGLVSIGVGILAFARPTAVAVLLLILVAVRALIVGVTEISTGVSVRRATGHSAWFMWLAGVASLIFGVLLLARPGAGILALVWIAGIYTIVFGVMLDAEAFRLRGVQRTLTARPA